MADQTPPAPVKKTDKKLFAGKAGPGRPKGVANKSTVVMKAAIMSVYEALQAKTGNDHGHFLEWAEQNSTEFYKLAAKLIPVQVEGGGEDGAIIHKIILEGVMPQ